MINYKKNKHGLFWLLITNHEYSLKSFEYIILSGLNVEEITVENLEEVLQHKNIQIMNAHWHFNFGPFEELTDKMILDCIPV